jgi:hypothetical protein
LRHLLLLEAQVLRSDSSEFGSCHALNMRRIRRQVKKTFPYLAFLIDVASINGYIWNIRKRRI